MDTTIAPSYYPSEQSFEQTMDTTTIDPATWDPNLGFLVGLDTDDFAADLSSSSPEFSPVAYSSPCFGDYFGVQDSGAGDYFPAPPPMQQPINDDWAGSKGIKHSASDDEDDDVDIYNIPSPPPAKKQQQQHRSSKSSSSSSSSSSARRGAAVVATPQEKPSAKSKPKHSLRTTTASRQPRGGAAAAAAASVSSSSPPSESSLYVPEDFPPPPPPPHQAQTTATENHRARHNHNLIEKQYRNRLNSQFEQLLAALPEEGCVLGEGKASSAANGRLGADDRRISKAGVLDKARRHIMALEAETRKLRAERKAMIENVHLMQQTMLAQGARGFGM